MTTAFSKDPFISDRSS